MEKARRPHVIRTWRVERTKLPYRPPQPARLPSNQQTIPPRRPERNPRPPAAPPEAQK